MNKVNSLKNIRGPTINNNNPNFDSINVHSPPISFNYFNFNNNKQKTRNKSKNRNFFNKNMNLNFGIEKIKSKNIRINPKINNFNHNF